MVAPFCASEEYLLSYVTWRRSGVWSGDSQSRTELHLCTEHLNAYSLKWCIVVYGLSIFWTCNNAAENYFFWWHVMNSAYKKSIKKCFLISEQPNEKRYLVSCMLILEDIESTMFISTVFTSDIAVIMCSYVITAYLLGMSQFLKVSSNNERLTDVSVFLKVCHHHWRNFVY